ncbi:MAG: response regulator [Phycisphaeraceae bacterium]|nr:response regulator [Phycisphaeraceae bacterium]
MRCLVIDDEIVACTKMAAMLEPFGRCDPAHTSAEAFNLFRQALHEHCPYDLATIDINLPDMNGITLLGRLRIEERQRGVPHARMLMVTAEGTASNVLAALSGECDGFLVKPVRGAVLIEKLVKLGMLTDDLTQRAVGAMLDQRLQPPAK